MRVELRGSKSSLPPPAVPIALKATHSDIHHPVLPDARHPSVAWSALHGSADALLLARARRHREDAPLVVVCPTPAEADHMVARLRFYCRDAAQVCSFPDLETLPYDNFSPPAELISERLLRLAELAQGKSPILVVAAGTLLGRLPPVQYVARVLKLKPGQQLDLTALRRQFETAGYRHVSQVMEHGEFAVRGSLVDLYPVGARQPVRIDLFDDEIESLRHFDPDSQRSEEALAELSILPAREFPLDADGIREFRQRYRAHFEGDPMRSRVYREVSAGNAFSGIEYYLPLFFEATAALTDLLPQNSLVCIPADLEDLLQAQWRQIGERYESLGVDPERPLLPPEQAFWSPQQLLAALARFPRIVLNAGAAMTREDPAAPAVLYSTEPPPAVALAMQDEKPAEKLVGFLREFPGRILIVAESAGRRETLLEALRAHRIAPQECADWAAFLEQSPPLAITVAPLDTGILVSEAGLAVLAEDQLFGERARRGGPKRRAARDPATVIRDLRDLRPGSPVVHRDHGVGRYLGLVTLEVSGYAQEFLALEYAGGDKLYVPVQSLERVGRYTGGSETEAPLHRLGGEQWTRVRRRAAERAHDVAAELLDIHARRAARQGYAMTLPAQEYRAFAAAFPFEETHDQQRAIEEVLNDLQAAQPMDRVVCGDVGFGKTEVALRASFMAAQNGYQVAVLVPTTLLAQQHYRNFADRFADWPVHVEVLSRFRSAKQIDRVLDELAQGKVDVIIGTHKLLSSSVKFHNLGLIIVDEEHRFGVRHKERLKSLRAEVHLLTLTATPIPRTLNMALGGLRSLSLITTPPPERLGVKTFVTQWSKAVIREACMREIKRGGQIYFVHNSIETIEKVAEDLAQIVPEAQIRVAHGQLPERELEQIMLDFYHRRFNLLLSTTIIESGIDVPTANTLLVNRADRFGLAQLHQLRGRVGRSHHRAYAYLLAPPEEALTADAVKRLEAIEALEDLGSGFALASHDLEIRGAGELLGEEQSGQMHEVGFELYLEMLERAVADLKAGRTPSADQPWFHGPEVNLGVPALLPESYLPDVHQRLILYKRIASAADAAALEVLREEMADRFGPLPEPARNLLRAARLKLRAAPLGVHKIDANAAGGRLVFHPDTRVDPLLLVALVQKEPQVYQLDGGDKLRFRRELADAEQRFAWVEALLVRLGEKTPKPAAPAARTPEKPARPVAPMTIGKPGAGKR